MVIDHGSPSFAPGSTGLGSIGPGSTMVAHRGLSPFDLIHGEPLVACAAWGLGEAGVQLLDASLPWQQVVELEGPFVAHDPLCPMTPPEFIVECVEQAQASGAIVVGVRPVTDTIKRVSTGSDGVARLGAGLDRDAVWSLAAPVVIPTGIVAQLADYPGPNLPDFVAQVVAAELPVTYLVGPPECRRVHDRGELALLSALTGQQPLGHR